VSAASREASRAGRPPATPAGEGHHGLPDRIRSGSFRHDGPAAFPGDAEPAAGDG
jgi:hypothetical protein